MSERKLSCAQNRKRKAKEEEEARKSRKLIKCFLKQNAEEEQEKNDIPSTVNDDDNRSVLVKLQLEDNYSNGDSEAEGRKDNSDIQEEGTIISSSDDEKESKDKRSTSVPPVLRVNDIGKLEFDQRSELPIISQQLRTELVTRGSALLQNKDGPFAKKGGRSMTTSWFERRLDNGQGDEVNRTWLLYSPSREAANCFCCLLLSESYSKARASFEKQARFTYWRKTSKVAAHEESASHRKSIRTWKETGWRICQKTGIDVALESDISSERERWRMVLQRLMNSIKYLASQNLALRGHVESLDAAEETNT